MDKLVAAIQGLSTTDENDLKQLKTTLAKSEDVLFKSLPSLDEALSVLDPNTHTLGWLYILGIKAVSNPEPRTFIGQVARFCMSCNARQLRMDVKKFRFICQKFVDVCVEHRSPISAIKPLRYAINKIAPSREHITPQHAMLMMCVLLSKTYSAVQSVIDSEVTEVDPDQTAVDSKDVRLYFYYAGAVYIGLKKFSRATEMLKTAISVPAIVPSAIMIEAYKKFVLVSLILSGQTGQLPRYTSSGLQRHFRHACAPYEELATSFQTRSLADVNKCIEQNREAYVKDGNWGLVKQATKALIRKNIQRLTQTYLTLSLQDIADNVKLKNKEEAEKILLRMIENKEIFAAINQKDGMVIFKDNTETYGTNETLNYLDKSIHNVMDITGKVERLDDFIASSAKYLQKTLAPDRSAGAAGGPGGPGRFGPMGGDDEDFDMMVRSGMIPGFRG
eukprot:TRINITY_DN7975_c0_g1_i1.p1 TRINITY_DN7975_c0_g1~~TRINITY_DN7975_c0_g1_i1.p1  ORF type:complete len:476 (+),score=162.47 TRINITY_DN7975_c0_g1_i1:89-1429(+)